MFFLDGCFCATLCLLTSSVTKSAINGRFISTSSSSWRSLQMMKDSKGSCLVTLAIIKSPMTMVKKYDILYQIWILSMPTAPSTPSRHKIRGFSKFLKIEFWWRQIFEHLIIHKPFHGVRRDPTKKLGPIGSAVLTFIGYKQTDTQTDKLNLYKD